MPGGPARFSNRFPWFGDCCTLSSVWISLNWESPKWSGRPPAVESECWKPVFRKQSPTLDSLNLSQSCQRPTWRHQVFQHRFRGSLWLLPLSAHWHLLNLSWATFRKSAHSLPILLWRKPSLFWSRCCGSVGASELWKTQCCLRTLQVWIYQWVFLRSIPSTVACTHLQTTSWIE